jgi:hypothetical protein
MLPGAWLWVWDGRTLLTSGFTTFAARLLTIAGSRGVLIKAADGLNTTGSFGPWDPAIVANLKAAAPGVQVGRGPSVTGAGRPASARGIRWPTKWRPSTGRSTAPCRMSWCSISSSR